MGNPVPIRTNRSHPLTLWRIVLTKTCAIFGIEPTEVAFPTKYDKNGKLRIHDI